MDLAVDGTRYANRLRDALLSISPALERVLGDRLHQAGIRDLLIKYPTTVALRHAGRARIKATVAKRSPRLGVKITEAIWTALDEQSVVVPAELRTTV